MSVSLVSVLVSQPVLVCFAVLWYVAVFVSGGFWVRFWRGAGRLSLLCTGLPHFSMFILSPILSIIIIIIIIKSEEVGD